MSTETPSWKPLVSWKFTTPGERASHTRLAELLREFHHPSVAGLQDFEYGSHEIRLFQQRPRGVSLQGWLQENRSCRGRHHLRWVCQQVALLADAVDRLHLQGLTLGSQDPGQIWVTYERELTLVDLGGFRFLRGEEDTRGDLKFLRQTLAALVGLDQGRKCPRALVLIMTRFQPDAEEPFLRAQEVASALHEACPREFRRAELLFLAAIPLLLLPFLNPEREIFPLEENWLHPVRKQEGINKQPQKKYYIPKSYHFETDSLFSAVNLLETGHFELTEIDEEGYFFLERKGGNPGSYWLAAMEKQKPDGCLSARNPGNIQAALVSGRWTLGWKEGNRWILVKELPVLSPTVGAPSPVAPAGQGF